MRELKDVATEHSKMKHRKKKKKSLKAVFSGPNPTMPACFHISYGFTSITVELSSF